MTATATRSPIRDEFAADGALWWISKETSERKARMLVAWLRGDSIEGIAHIENLTIKTARTYIASAANRCRIAKKRRAEDPEKYIPLTEAAGEHG